jgi:hypothetical protein
MRRLSLSITLAMSLVALSASTALAAAPEGAQKAPMYSSPGIPCATGATPTPTTFGFAILNTPGDETTLTGQVALKGVAPNATYAVGLDAVPLCVPEAFVGEITTNNKGNGTLHFTIARFPGVTKFFVTAKTLPFELYGSPAVELD